MRLRACICLVAATYLGLLAGLPSIAAAKKQQQAKKPAASAKGPAIDPKAQELMRQMSDYLSGLNQFKFHADTSLEGVLPSGLKLDTDQNVDVFVQRPDHLRANVVSATRDRQFYYDGKNVTVYAGKVNYYGVVPAPASIDQTLEAAMMKAGVVMPLADFLYSNPYGILMEKVQSGIYVGPGLVRGVKTHHLAFRQKAIDWQIWIEDSATPVPRQLIITDKGNAQAPRFKATLTDWDFSPRFDESTFTFVPPEGAQKIGFLPKQKLPGQMAPGKTGKETNNAPR